MRSLEEMGFDATPFAFEEFKFADEPPMPAEDEEPETESRWLGEIKLKCPAETIDNFEAELDDLLKRYSSVTKETKRSK